VTTFHFSMDVVFLVYGLAFLSLGLTIVILNERDSALEVSRVLWLLAAFGFVHGFHEWLDLWRIVRGDNAGLAATRPVVLLISYLFLFEFGRRLVLASQSVEQRASLANRMLHPWIYAPMLLGILAGVLASDRPISALAIWSRYMPGFFGPGLAGVGFYLYCQNRIGADSSTSDYPGFSAAWYVAAATFIAYGIFGGLVGYQVDWLPGSVINEQSFLAKFGVPVQLLRAACAVVAAISIGRLLRIFRYDNQRKLGHALNIGQLALAECYQILSRFEAILDSAMEGIIGLDHTGSITFVNGSALHMLGYRKEELIGQPFHVLSQHVATSDKRRLVKNSPIFHTLLTGEMQRVSDERLWRKNRTWFPVSYQTAPLQHGDQIHGVVVAFRDTIEITLAERRLREVEYLRMQARAQEMQISPRAAA